jgi:hypothetical protein
MKLQYSIIDEIANGVYVLMRSFSERRDLTLKLFGERVTSLEQVLVKYFVTVLPIKGRY